MINISCVTKSYDDTIACKNININVNKGEFFTLLGPSGCGKTTLLRLIAGFISSDSGKILLGGKDITNMPIEKRKIGMVFQNYALFPHMNVYDNVSYGLKIRKIKKKSINEKVIKYLELVNLSGYENRNISELSGGEQQRVALARALIVEPEVLLLDEPLSNLDAKLKEKMRKELKSIQKKLGITTIFVTHDQQEALTISDRIAVFNEGECLQVGSPYEIYQNPLNRFVATFIGDTNLFEKSNFPFLIEDTINKYITIRPQDIRISKEKISNYNGIIKDINIIGALIEYLISYKGHMIKAISINSFVESNMYKIGENVYLNFARNNLRSFKD